MEEKKKSIIILAVLNIAFNISNFVLGYLAITSKNPVHIIIFGIFTVAGVLIWIKLPKLIKGYKESKNTKEENAVRDLYITKQLGILVPILKKEIEVYKEVLYKIHYGNKDLVCSCCGSHAISTKPNGAHSIICTCSNCGGEWSISSEEKNRMFINSIIDRTLRYAESPSIDYNDVNKPRLLNLINVDDSFLERLKNYPIETIVYVNREEDMMDEKDILKYILEEFEINLGVKLIGFKSLKYVWKEEESA